MFVKLNWIYQMNLCGFHSRYLFKLANPLKPLKFNSMFAFCPLNFCSPISWRNLLYHSSHWRNCFDVVRHEILMIFNIEIFGTRIGSPTNLIFQTKVKENIFQEKVLQVSHWKGLSFQSSYLKLLLIDLRTLNICLSKKFD